MATHFRAEGTIQSALEAGGLSAETLARLTERLRQGDWQGQNQIRGKLAAPAPGDIPCLPGVDTREYGQLEREGRRIIREGGLGCVVLAGGMATRFGGVVKAEVPVLQGKTFLDLKLATISRVAQTSGATVQVMIMTSVFTDQRIRDALRNVQYANLDVETFCQGAAPRLTPHGETVLDAAGACSLAATGHGDLPFALRKTGLLGRFLARGGKVLTVSNVDNIAAWPSPAIIGAHAQLARKITVEAVTKTPDDHGGVPVFVDGSLQVVEQYRLPPSFPCADLTVFNTNTFVMDAGALDRDFELDWFAVSKRSEGREVVQFERLLGQLTAFLPTAFLQVPRGGTNGRFLPVKDRQELTVRLPEIQAVLAGLGIELRA